jgi:hypothetical protein
LANLRIPEKYKLGLAKLRSLSDESFNKLVAALERCPPMIKAEDISNRLAPSIPEIPVHDIESIVRATSSLYFLRIDVGVSVDKLASDVCDAMRFFNFRR